MDKLFTTKSCTQCAALKPHLSANNLDVEIIDAEDNPELAFEHGIMNVPTIVTTNGDRYVGGAEGVRYIHERKAK
ncbi:glutaredoxin family protein [Macrococcus capreoli]|uniref:glutaredoxin family protein n=1 Tax=Macrococcus capreoli TaxID=2982690 RepID=UPI0021D603E1|nr:glutaredoxin domain-containing protein [Macrococcus sp. TMW 2.2395]MCU7556561.1 thioredoxin family protein [Macrococcus sp. TMW 2.2395]